MRTHRQKPQQTAWRLSVHLGAGVSVMSLCLALLGYGYALAVETAFGIQESLFADGALDYVRLSSHVVAFAISGLAASLASSAFYVGLYEKFGLHAWGATLLWALALLTIRCSRWRQWLRTVALAAAHAQPSPAVLMAARRWMMAWKWGLVSLAGIWALVPAVAGLLMALVCVPAVLLAAVPLMGYEIGVRSLQHWVVEPLVCLQPRSRDLRMVEQVKPSGSQAPKVRGVACVRVQEKGGKEAVQGRLVVATARWAVLFDPSSGSVKRVSVQNADITPLASLDAPDAPSHAHADAPTPRTPGAAGTTSAQ